MRLTKKLCALVSSLAVGASAQGVAQTPAQNAPAGDEQKMRDALRKALQGDAPASEQRAVPPIVARPVETPATPSAPNTNITSFPAPTTAYSTNVFYDTNGVPYMPLNLAEAIRMALEHNLTLQVARYNPVIFEYNRRALWGYYDPTFNSGYSRISSAREAGGINLNTGNATPGTSTEVDQFEAGLSGNIPSGMTYGFTHSILHNAVTTPFLLTSNGPLGQPIFGTREDKTWSSAAAFTARQPLLRDLWIDEPRLKIKLAKRDQSIEQLRWERTIMDIANRVEQAYYGLGAAREAVRAGETDLSLKQQFFDEQRRRVEVGTIAPLDEKLAQAEVAKSKSILVDLQGRAADAEVLLKGLIHDDFIGHLKVRLQLTDRLMALPTVVDLYDTMRQAEARRPDLQQQRLVLEQWNLRLKYDFNQLFPRLDVFGTLGYNGLDRTFGGALQDIRDRNFEQSVVGVSISTPLTLWTERNRYKSDKQAKEQAIWEYKRQTEVVYEEIEVQARLLGTYWMQIPLRREVVVAQQQALEAEKKKFDAGKSTSFQVLQIASDLTAAQVAEISAILIYNQALSEMEFRKGTTLERWKIDVVPAPK
jgi:outer membrane protein